MPLDAIPYCLLPQPDNHRFMGSLSGTILAVSRKWTHAVFLFLWLAYFILYTVFQVHPRCCMWHDFLLFSKLNNIPLFAYTFSLSIHLLMVWRIKTWKSTSTLPSLWKPTLGSFQANTRKITIMSSAPTYPLVWPFTRLVSLILLNTQEARNPN